MKIKFVLQGEPKGKARPKSSIGKDRRIHVYTPSDTVKYEKLIKEAYLSAADGFVFPESAQLDLRVIAYFGIPESDSRPKKEKKAHHFIRPTKKPDWDNIGKIVADALNMVAYHDDTQIVDAQVRKFYSIIPRIEVILQEAERPEEN